MLMVEQHMLIVLQPMLMVEQHILIVEEDMLLAEWHMPTKHKAICSGRGQPAGGRAGLREGPQPQGPGGHRRVPRHEEGGPHRPQGKW